MENRKLKVSFNNKIKIMKPTPESFEELEEQISRKFNLQVGTYTITYQDEEGDEITIEQEDWENMRDEISKIFLHVCSSFSTSFTFYNPLCFFF